MDALTQKLTRLRDRFVRLKGDWSEQDHPRADDGTFGAGGAGSEGSGKKPSSDSPAKAKPGKEFGKLSGAVEKAHAAAAHAVTALFELPEKERRGQAVPVLRAQLKTLRSSVAARTAELIPKVAAQVSENTGLPEESFAGLKNGVKSFAKSATADTAHEFSTIAHEIKTGGLDEEFALEKLHEAYDLMSLDGHDLIDSFEEPIGDILTAYEDAQWDRTPEGGSEEEQDQRADKIAADVKALEKEIGAALVTQFMSRQHVYGVMRDRGKSMDALTQKLTRLRDRFARLKGDWSEGDHPRDDSGQFGSGSGDEDGEEQAAAEADQAAERRGTIEAAREDLFAAIGENDFKHRLADRVAEAGATWNGWTDESGESHEGLLVAHEEYDGIASADKDEIAGQLQDDWQAAGKLTKEVTEKADAALADLDERGILTEEQTAQLQTVRDAVVSRLEKCQARLGKDSAAVLKAVDRWAEIGDPGAYDESDPASVSRHERWMKASTDLIDAADRQQHSLSNLDDAASLDKLFRKADKLLRTAKSGVRGKLLRLRNRFRQLLKGGDFNEQDHPRADDGKFGSGGGGADSGKKPAGKKPAAARPAKAPTRTPQEVAAFTAKLKGALDSGALTAAHVPKIAAALGELTLAQLQEVKAAVGIKASGAKAAQATAIAQKALAAVQARAKPAAPAKPAKPPKADAAKVHAGIADLLASGEPLNATHVSKISAALQGLTVKEIQAVKEKLGIKASGPKAKLAQSIAAQAVASVKPKPVAKPEGGVAAPAVAPATRNPPNHAVPDQGRPPLDAAEVAAVQRYTGSAYRGINASLRRYGTVAGDYTQTHQDLQKAFAKAQPFDKPVDVARGMNMGTADLQAFTAQMQDALNTDSAVKVSGYTSTSTGGIPAGFEGNVEVHIKAKRGLDVAQHSINPEEKELLLDHNSQFKPLSVKRVGHKLIVHMEQV